MYIDKRLSGANVVQTLGRLNRIAPVSIYIDTYIHLYIRQTDVLSSPFLQE
jgi:type I site-specific restriction-modification system R (restriction) subunit